MISDYLKRAHAPRALTELGGVGGVAVALLIVISINIAAFHLKYPVRAGGWPIRLLAHLYDCGQHCALAAVALAAALGVRRFRLYPAASFALMGALLSVFLAQALWVDLSIFAQRFVGGEGEALLKLAIATGLAFSIVAAWYVVRLLPAQTPVLAVAGAGVSALALNHWILRGDYPGVHLTLTVGAATVLSAATSRLVAPQWYPRRLHPLAGIALLGLALGSVALPPPNRVLVELLRSEGSSVAPSVALFHTPSASIDPNLAKGSRWFRDQSTAPPTPPTLGRPLVKDPIVLLIAFEAMRADLIANPEYRKNFNALSSLMKRAVLFTNARAGGTQTVYSITSIFSGRYFSQLYWSKGAPRGTRADKQLFPHADTTVRFPQVLQQAKIRTVTMASNSWLVNSVGVVRGFDEERFIRRGPGNSKYALAEDMTDAAIERLTQQGEGPQFLFIHFLDSHAPYHRGGHQSSAFDAYFAAIKLIDRQVGRLIKTLRQAGLGRRLFVIITSDHGEAFGEHGTFFHCSTLYEELVRVPLLFVGPGIKARPIADPVSLLDIGPTILDIFGLATPGHFMGESLLGYLRGQNPALTRPIVAEGRLKKSWLFSDNFKLIVDDRLGTAELYDLTRDPLELKNRFDSDPTATRRLSTLRTFFQIHRIRRRGYQIPYRR